MTSRKVIRGQTDAASKHPELLLFVDPENSVPLHQIHSGDQKTLVSWRCEKHNHQYKMSVYKRKTRDFCPYCNNREPLVGFNTLADFWPEVNQYWSDANKDTPEDVLPGSPSKRQWSAPCGHEWFGEIRGIAKRKSCGPCANTSVVQTGLNDLATQKPEIAAQWHATKNTISPDEVRYGSAYKAWWQCDTHPEHHWLAAVDNRTSKSGRGCAVCAGQYILAGVNTLATSHPDLAKELVDIDPETITTHNNNNVLWKCVDGHTWSTTPSARVAGNGCPYCATSGRRKATPGVNSFAVMYPKLLSEWADDCNPDELSSGSGYRAAWLCATHGVWRAPISLRTRENSGSGGCPGCRTYGQSTVETGFFNYIKSMAPDAIQGDRSLLGKNRELDVYIPSLNLAFEFNGLYWHSDRFKADKYHMEKTTLCKDKGIRLIHIWEDSWAFRQDRVKSIIKNALNQSNDVKYSARSLKVGTSTYAETANFMDTNHLQGQNKASKYYTLSDDDGIRAVLSATMIKNPKGGKPPRLEITRYATSGLVRGGFSRLLKKAEADFPEAQEVHSYSDNDYTTGRVYASSGFTLVADNLPSYGYWTGGLSLRESRQKFQKRRFKNDPALLWDPEMTEKQLAELNKIYRVWTSGNSLWVKKLI